jgi:4-amino-4-deoxy-L-arabinose transferase-like glycosyltransferase
MKKRWLIAAIVIYVIVRIYIATLSSYGFYHGWNEGWYSLIAKNYFSGSLWEQIAYPGGGPFASAPPFFSYAVYASFKIFGISDISARLVSILSEIIALSGVYILAKELYDERIADIATIIFLFIPWNILWFGRAQTDPLMTAIMTLAIALYVRAYRNHKSMLPFGIILGLAVFTKQPALAALPIVLIWSYFQGIKKNQIISAITCFLIGMLPFLIWLLYYAFSGNYNVIFNIILVRYNSDIFSNMARVILFTAAGVLPILIVATYQIFKERNVKNILVIWLLIYGAFVLVRTPPSHEYYSLPMIAPLAIIASVGIVRISNMLNKKSATMLLVAAIIISQIPITYIFLSHSGDSGYIASKDVGIFLRNYMNENPDNDYLVLVQVKYSPQIAWYSGLELYGRRQIYSTGDELSVKYVNGIINNYPNKTVFLVADEESGKGVINEYEKVYESLYNENIVDLGRAFGLVFKAERGLMIFKLR